MGAVEKRQSMPILSNVLLKIQDDILHLIATDLEIELQARTALESVAVSGAITVPARKLFDIVKALPETMIHFTLDNEQLILACERSRFKLSVLKAEDFPNVQGNLAESDFQISQSIFKTLLENVYFSMAQQDVRYYLNGIYLMKSSDQLKVVATDGHRLAFSKHLLSLDAQDMACILPRKAVLEFLRILQHSDELVSVGFDDNHFRIRGEDYLLITKLIDGAFPDYQQVIPKNTSKQIIIEKDLIKHSLSRIAVLSNEKYHGVKFHFENNQLNIEAHNSEHEEAFEQISIDYAFEPFEIGFNVSYLMEAINALPNGDIIFSMQDANTPLQIESNSEDNHALYVIMPMRI